jgi:hypothetical protein
MSGKHKNFRLSIPFYSLRRRLRELEDEPWSEHEFRFVSIPVLCLALKAERQAQDTTDFIQRKRDRSSSHLIQHAGPVEQGRDP